MRYSILWFFAAPEFGAVEIAAVWVVPNTFAAAVGVSAATSAEAGGQITTFVGLFGWGSE